jgi:hypothetical protein
MKRSSENSVGEPGQFKTTPVIGFTPTDHTPTKPPAAERELRKRRNQNSKRSIKAAPAEHELKKRVLRHRRKGLKDTD